MHLVVFLYYNNNRVYRRSLLSAERIQLLSSKRGQQPLFIAYFEIAFQTAISLCTLAMKRA